MFIKATNLTVERPNSPALHFREMQINAGDKILLSGPSGSGKTTLLSVLAGLLKPHQGMVEFEGADIYALPEHKRDNLRGQRFGFIFQTLHLLPSSALLLIFLPGILFRRLQFF